VKRRPVSLLYFLCIIALFVSTIFVSTTFKATPSSAATPDFDNPIYVGAIAETSDVLFETSDNTTHASNGVEWYNNGSSFGFAPSGGAVNIVNGIDTNNAQNNNRMSWPLSGGEIIDGGRAGEQAPIFSGPWHRVAYKSTTASPAFLPDGVFVNTSTSDLDGWTKCYDANYNDISDFEVDFANACGDSDYILVAAQAQGKFTMDSEINGQPSNEVEHLNVDDTVRPTLFRPDGTEVNWNKFRYYISNCSIGENECYGINGPETDPDLWDDGTFASNDQFDVPQDAGNHIIAIVAADSATGDPLFDDVETLLIAVQPAEFTFDVTSCSQLNEIGQDFDNSGSTITLMNDLDCEDVNFQSMFKGTFFLGTFDGNNHSIRHLTISEDTNNIGLISAMDADAVVKDVTLESGKVSATINSDNDSGAGFAGTLVGLVKGGTIDNVGSQIPLVCSSSSFSCGGLIGTIDQYDQDVTVQDSYAIGGVAGGNDTIGGFVGNIGNQGSSLDIRRDFSAGLVKADNAVDKVGGFAGYVVVQTTIAHVVAINDIYSRTDVYAPNANHVGGLIGYAQTTAQAGGEVSLAIIASYSAGSVQGNFDTGGIVGYINPTTANSYFTLSYTFSFGPVFGSGSAGAILGDNEEAGAHLIFTNNYWDKTRVGPDLDAQGSGATPSSGIAYVGVNDNNSAADYFFNNDTIEPFYSTVFNTLVWDIPDTWSLHENNLPTLNGVGPADEQAAPNDGDANYDGIPDNVQTNVHSFLDPVANKWVTVEMNPGNTIFDVNVFDTADPDPGFSYPWGQVGFYAYVTQGQNVPVTFTFHDVDSGNFVAKKHLPGFNAFEDINNATNIDFDTDLHTTRVGYSITDGGYLDQDGQTNGRIFDPFAFASVNDAAAIPAPNSGSASNLPATGVNAAGETIFALIILAFGALLIAGTRFRRPLSF
jgi:hypothetical protein